MAASSSGSTHQRNALVLAHLSLADSIGAATARRLFPLVERDDLIQVAREALVRSAPRCRPGEPAAGGTAWRSGFRPIVCVRRGCRKGMRSTSSLALTAA